MPIEDLLLVVCWWGVWLVMGLLGWPIARNIFGKLDDLGYGLAKIIGAAATTYLVWVMGTLHLVKFGMLAVAISAGIVIGVGLVLNKLRAEKEKVKINWKLILAEEALFLVLLTSWAWVRGHQPDVRDLEKFMDYGITKSILNSEYFPPADMWFAGEAVNYYYFGHLIMAVVTESANISLDEGFNLMLATIFALCFTMSWAIGRRVLKDSGRKAQVVGGLFIATILTLGGNLHTIYAYTSGYKYDSDDPPPFWEIMINPFDSKARIDGWSSYWYPNATRFIPYTIHEFPSYSFVVSDIHGHVLSIPLALLAIALIVYFFVQGEKIGKWEGVIYGVVAGWLFTTNALDGPIYLTIFAALLVGRWIKSRVDITTVNLKKIVVLLSVVILTFVVTTLPFVTHFKSFVAGVGVNCPPSFLAYQPTVAGDDGIRKIGPLVFGTIDKCQRSPVWMLFILWGFFGYCAIKLLTSKPVWGNHRALTIICICSLGLILFAEVFYFKDIYPQHFRSNTMFKLGYQAFMIMSIISGATIVKAIEKWKKNWIFLVILAPMIYLVLIYPLFSVKSYFGELTREKYQGLNGISWIGREHPDDLEAIYWLRRNVADFKQEVILEATGDSYTDYDRISTFTGLPTVAGWTVHEWLWRGDYSPVAARNEEVRQVYEVVDPEIAKGILNKYKVRYIVIGNMERKKYLNMNEELVEDLGQIVFGLGTVKIIKIN